MGPQQSQIDGIESSFFGQLAFPIMCVQRFAYFWEKAFILFVFPFVVFGTPTHTLTLINYVKLFLNRLSTTSFFYINIANFEVFLYVKKLSANLFFLKSALKT